MKFSLRLRRNILQLDLPMHKVYARAYVETDVKDKKACYSAAHIAPWQDVVRTRKNEGF